MSEYITNRTISTGNKKNTITRYGIDHKRVIVLIATMYYELKRLPPPPNAKLFTL